MPTLSRSLAVLSAAVPLTGGLFVEVDPQADHHPGPPPAATALIGSAAEPVPDTTTDGRTHLAYELLLTNTLGGNATLRSLTVCGG